MSKLLNSNFRLKIGRTLYGYAGGIRLLGESLLHHIIAKAMRSKKQVYTYKCTKLNLVVKLYAK